MEGSSFAHAVLSRRRFLALAGLGAVAAAAGGVAGKILPPGAPAAPVVPGVRRQFASRPDLTPPTITVHHHYPHLAPGYIFFTPGNGAAPDGPMIVDDSGEPIWVHPDHGGSAVNLRVATYRGEPVLTWWEGTIANGFGAGEYVIANSTYAEVARVRAGNGLLGDLHEFVISPNDTALFLIANRVPGNVVSGDGQTTNGGVIEAVVQEVDIGSGRVLFEWHSLPAIDPSESYLAPPTNGSDYDYLHANSIAIDLDGNLLVSGRHTWAIYKVDRQTGAVVWRLNGRSSDFAVEADARFAWQHDARRQSDGSLSIFDDGAAGTPPQFEANSRGIVLEVNDAAKTARLRRAFTHPDGVLVQSQGSFQPLPTLGGFVGWGAAPRFSEFDAQGNLVYDATFDPGQQSYRSMRYPWVGRPQDQPMVAANPTAGGGTVAVASWNGATEVARWNVLGGPTPTALVPLATALRAGFETTITIGSAPAFVAVGALDAEGQELGRSAAVEVTEAGQ